MHPGPMNRGLEISVRRRRLAPLHRAGAGPQRRLHPDGGPVPAARPGTPANRPPPLRTCSAATSHAARPNRHLFPPGEPLMAEQQQNASNSGAYLIRGAAILGGAAEDLLIRDGVIAARGQDLDADGAGGGRNSN